MEILGYSADKLSYVVDQLLPSLRKSVSGVATYGFIHVNQGQVNGEVCSNHACIAGMMSYYRAHLLTDYTPLLVVYDLSTSTVRTSITPARLAWCKWVATESPWRHAFVMLDKYNPDVNGVLVSRTDLSANYLATANNILRIGIENADKLKSWHTLVEGGVNKSMSLLLCTHQVEVYEDSFVLGYSHDYWSHSILDSTHKEGMLKLLSGHIGHNEGYLDLQFYKSGLYNGAHQYLYELGKKYKTPISTMLCHTLDVKRKSVSLGEDLLGRCLGEVSGLFFSADVLNKFWSDYESAD